MDSYHRESKMVKNMELFDKARTYGHFLNQRHTVVAQGFRIAKRCRILAGQRVAFHGTKKHGPIERSNLSQRFSLNLYTSFKKTIRKFAQIAI